MQRKRRGSCQDEPFTDPADLFDTGHGVIWVAGYTPGGHPFGIDAEELRYSSAESEPEKGWARALEAIRAAVSHLGLEEAEIGRVRWLGEGLSRRAFAARVDTLAPGWPRVLVALVPRGPSDERGRESVRAEARLLRHLTEHARDYRVPGRVAFTHMATLVCDHVEGFPVDLRKGRSTFDPIELVADVAAAIHRTSLEGLDWLPGSDTLRAHGEERLRELDPLTGNEPAEVRAAMAWLSENLPPPEPSRLIHGDLLGQNLLYHPERKTAVIDWEYARRGDPAHDLAILTGGVKRPFQIADGMARLLSAYAVRSDREVLEVHVRFHEIALHLSHFQNAMAGKPGAEPVASVMARLRNLLRSVNAG
ncbi:Phosphotransferase enzyme family protein [Planctomycetes bacterium Poly30]|uniref:Phosphotransferase enzyme family protein n=1 Tax=Saltatorellus ferox TaxID=2528018 RepID=A0A518EL90_9BACT|nr:Phosphotransferase enzyme family protein [Planctomycetes bacterium Poly30]